MSNNIHSMWPIKYDELVVNDKYESNSMKLTVN